MYYPLGWKPFEERTDYENQVHNGIVSKLPSFNLVGEKPPVGTKILLTDLWKHPLVIEALGQPFTGWHQFTGSCVGVGGGNAAQSTCFADIIIRDEPELPVILFWPYNYGDSRKRAGMNGKGEGSLGSTMAASMGEGMPIWSPDWSQLPPYTTNSGFYEIGQAQELIWSDGNTAPQALREFSKKHRMFNAPVTSAAQVRDALLNGYACTRAFSKFVNPGSASVKNGVLYSGTYDGRGGHQESWLGYWNHPQLGELFYEMNQWKDVYGKDPAGGATGGLWLPYELIDRECANGEIYVLSNYEGFPAQPKIFEWTKNSFWS